MTSPNTIEKHMDQTKIPLAVVMVPLPPQGHLNQLLHLSRLVSAYDIPVHFISTATHNRQALTRVHGWDPLAVSNIKFHNLPTPPFDNHPPNPSSPIKYPTHMIPMLKAVPDLRAPVYNLVEKLSTTVEKLVVIYDSLMTYVVQDIHVITNAKSYCFQTISAFSLYSLFQAGKESILDPYVKAGPSFEGCFRPELVQVTMMLNMAPRFNSGDLYNTSRAIEGLYIDMLAKEKSTGTDKNWAIGPFNPVSVPQKTGVIGHKSLDWLDKQEPNSVMYISFGLSSSLLYEQIEELSLGLERSQVKFIWVLRCADKGDIFEGDVIEPKLPEEFEERIRGRGIIVRDWVPQLEILGHASTGGFISHCGWNSCMESISMGVAIATWPMHTDQPRNAFLITNVLKIGVELKNWEQRDKVISACQVENVVRKLMSSIEGEEIRKRAMELKDVVKKSLMEGGVTKKEMDSFIAHIAK